MIEIVATSAATPLISLFMWFYIITVFINLIIAIEITKATSKDWTLIFFILGGFFSWIAFAIALMFTK